MKHNKRVEMQKRQQLFNFPPHIYMHDNIFDADARINPTNEYIFPQKRDSGGENISLKINNFTSHGYSRRLRFGPECSREKFRCYRKKIVA